jgi:hypothetical protein
LQPLDRFDDDVWHADDGASYGGFERPQLLRYGHLFRDTPR